MIEIQCDSGKKQLYIDAIRIINWPLSVWPAAGSWQSCLLCLWPGATGTFPLRALTTQLNLEYNINILITLRTSRMGKKTVRLCQWYFNTGGLQFTQVQVSTQACVVDDLHKAITCGWDDTAYFEKKCLYRKGQMIFWCMRKLPCVQKPTIYLHKAGAKYGTMFNTQSYTN